MANYFVTLNSYVTGYSSYLGKQGDRYVTFKAQAKVFTSREEAVAVAKAEQARIKTAHIDIMDTTAF